jgi:hypothetical protein
MEQQAGFVEFDGKGVVYATVGSGPLLGHAGVVD